VEIESYLPAELCICWQDLVPDPGNLLQADVPMEEEEEEEGEHHPPHQNGVRHHNGDVIGQASYVCRAVGRSGLGPG
jgi:hypothetical protein